MMNLDEKIRNEVRKRNDIPKRDMLVISRKKADKQMEAFSNYITKKEHKPMKKTVDPKSKSYHDICNLRDYLRKNPNLADEDLSDVYEVAEEIMTLIKDYTGTEYDKLIKA